MEIETIILIVVLLIHLYLYIIGIIGLAKKEININYIRFIPAFRSGGLRSSEMFLKGKQAIIASTATIALASVIPALLFSLWVSIKLNSDAAFVLLAALFLIASVTILLILGKQYKKTKS